MQLFLNRWQICIEKRCLLYIYTNTLITGYNNLVQINIEEADYLDNATNIISQASITAKKAKVGFCSRIRSTTTYNAENTNEVPSLKSWVWNITIRDLIMICYHLKGKPSWQSFSYLFVSLKGLETIQIAGKIEYHYTTTTIDLDDGMAGGGEVNIKVTSSLDRWKTKNTTHHKQQRLLPAEVNM